MVCELTRCAIAFHLHPSHHRNAYEKSNEYDHAICILHFWFHERICVANKASLSLCRHDGRHCRKEAKASKPSLVGRLAAGASKIAICIRNFPINVTCV